MISKIDFSKNGMYLALSVKIQANFQNQRVYNHDGKRAAGNQVILIVASWSCGRLLALGSGGSGFES